MSRRRGAVRIVRTVVGVAAVAGAVLGLLAVPLGSSAAAAGPGAGPAIGTAPVSHPLTVLSYNIHHAQGADGVLDLERIATVIERSGARVVTLQEVDKHFGTRSDDVDQAGWLGQRLGMHVVFGANLDLAPTTPGAPRRQFGTAILSVDPIVRWQNTLLPKLPAGEQRGLLEAVIDLGDSEVRVLTTHLQHDNTPERMAQIQRIAELTADCDQPTVLTGDMNAPPGSPEYDALQEHFSDVWPVAGRGPEYTFDSDDPKGRIDYVFTANGVTPRVADVMSTIASDHLPLRAFLRVPGSSGGC